MHLLTFALAAMLQVQDTAAADQPLDSATIASAYHDAGAAALAAGVRARRDRAERNITAYQALVQENVSLGMRALRRDRLVFRRETAARIDWQRNGPVKIDIVGAREVLPIFVSKPQIPAGMLQAVPHLAFDPGDERLILALQNSKTIRHPLATGGERDYRFRSGGTTTLTLPDGRRLTLHELQFIPRRKDWKLITGSFWIDQATHAVVQAVFKLSRPFDLDVDGDEGDSNAPGFMRPIRADVSYVTIEYGLVEFRWWLPRLVALQGVAEMGSMLKVPLRYELAYSDYEVTGDTLAAPLPPEAVARDSVRCPSSITIGVQTSAGSAATPDTAEQRRKREERREAEPDSIRERRERRRVACERYVVTIPDSSALLTSEHLSESAFAMGETLVSESELRELGEQIRSIPGVPWQLGMPSLQWGFGRQGLARYNRVEGLSVGARVASDFGPLSGEAVARIGFADLEPNAELALARQTTSGTFELRGFRRLAAMDRNRRPFSLGNSLNAFVLGRDDIDYYRAAGVELNGAPAAAVTQWYSWRLYAQRETGARKETNVSIRRLLDSTFEFRDNIPAQRADQAGAALALHFWRGQNPNGLRGGVDVEMEASRGTFDYMRPSVTLRSAFPLPGAFVGALEGATGTSAGELPVQHLWYLGGSSTLRGYPGSTDAGEAFWRARAEVGTALPMFRLVLFSDAGRATPRDRVWSGTPLWSAGAGASFLDGLFRVDLARALRAPTGWRASVYVDAAL